MQREAQVSVFTRDRVMNGDEFRTIGAVFGLIHLSAMGQRGKQLVFLGAGGIDGIDGTIGWRCVAFIVEIRPKFAARNSSGRLDRNHTLSRHPVPIGNRRLSNAYFAGKFSNTACLIDRAR